MRITTHTLSAFALAAALTPLSAEAVEAEISIEPFEARPILYQLPLAYSTSPGPIDLTVSVEGREVHEERITLVSSAPDRKMRLATSPVFELLAATPDRRTWLGHLAENDPGIELRITIDAQEVERLGWEELQDRAARLDLERLQPIRVELTEVQADSRVPFPVLPNKARNLEECLEDCEDDYFACGTTTACQDDFIACASGCGFTGACTPTTTESSVLTPLGFQFAGEYTCTDYFSPQSFRQYALYGNKYRRTTTSVHTNFYCRQTTTVEVDYVYYNQCWQLYSFSCLPGVPVASFPPFTPYLCN